MLVAYTGYTQSNGLGSWNVLNIKYQTGEKTSIFAEAQLRSLQFYDQFHYYEYKGGFTYGNNAIKISLAAGQYVTYKEGGDFRRPKNNDEFRLWPQLLLTQKFGRIVVEQRYRHESRFTTMGYRNRFRYRVGASYQFGSGDDKPWQVTVNNEIFLTDRSTYFERNRLQGLISRTLTETTSVQTGYLHQFDYQINDETGRDFLVVGFYFDVKK
jgi:hypothetical protein